MNHSSIRLAVCVVFAVGGLGCGCASTGAGNSQEDSGYFLSLRQKAQLIGKGRMQDSRGTWYDVRICPGYTYPVKFGWRNIKEGTRNFGEYFGSKKYRDLAENSGDCLEWGFEDCLWEFGLEGSGKAWGRHFGHASRRIERRVFGWWLAYPWALFQSVVETAFRVPVGCTGAGLGVTAGVGIVPAWHLSNSGTKAVWNGGVEGLVLPVSGLAWNTAVSPSLALLGQKPARSRVDGFWVRVVGSGESLVDVDKKDLAPLAMWGILLESELNPYVTEQKALQEKNRKKIKTLYEQMRDVRKETSEGRKRIRSREERHVRRILVDPENRKLAERLRELGWSASYINRHRKEITSALRERGSLSPERINRIIHLLRRFPAADIPAPEVVQPEKTDPVTESIEVIRNID